VWEWLNDLNVQCPFIILRSSFFKRQVKKDNKVKEAKSTMLAVLPKSIREGRGDKTEFTSSKPNLEVTKLVHLRVEEAEIFSQPPKITTVTILLLVSIF
jgi:hypothetical protein